MQEDVCCQPKTCKLGKAPSPSGIQPMVMTVSGIPPPPVSSLQSLFCESHSTTGVPISFGEHWPLYLCSATTQCCLLTKPSFKRKLSHLNFLPVLLYWVHSFPQTVKVSTVGPCSHRRQPLTQSDYYVDAEGFSKNMQVIWRKRNKNHHPAMHNADSSNCAFLVYYSILVYNVNRVTVYFTIVAKEDKSIDTVITCN